MFSSANDRVAVQYTRETGATVFEAFRINPETGEPGGPAIHGSGHAHASRPSLVIDDDGIPHVQPIQHGQWHPSWIYSPIIGLDYRATQGVCVHCRPDVGVALIPVAPGPVCALPCPLLPPPAQSLRPRSSEHVHGLADGHHGPPCVFVAHAGKVVEAEAYYDDPGLA